MEARGGKSTRVAGSCLVGAWESRQLWRARAVARQIPERRVGERDAGADATEQQTAAAHVAAADEFFGE